ncbi:MAG: hypothetical protein KBA31_09630 [Alphaproteobacteria bacterium]|nr:hypothetical protein [Alphaproteobacteria bacterium]
MDTTTKKMLEEILSTVKGLDARLSKLEARSATGSTDAEPGISSSVKRLSLKEFLIDRTPSNGVQMTLAIAYFLENHGSVSPFNATDLEQGFRAAREPVPPNINDKANMCVKNGYFMEEKSKKDSMKAWVVTRTGDELVKSGFGKAR